MSLSLSLSIYICREATVLAFSGLSQALIVACTAEEDKQKKGKKEGAKRTVSMDGRERKMPEAKHFVLLLSTPKSGSYHLPSPDL